MITKQKVRTFEHYQGDVDRFDANQTSHRGFTHGEFILLLRIVFDLQTKHTKSLSDLEQIEQIRLRMKESCDGAETIDFLREAAQRMPLLQ